jgi:hypothetical protein
VLESPATGLSTWWSLVNDYLWHYCDKLGTEDFFPGRCVMNMTFTQTDWQRSQLSIKPTHSQIGCVDQELSQLRGYAEIYICRNDQVLSARIGTRADRTGAWKASRFSQVWTGSGSEEASVPRKEVLGTQLAWVRIPTRSAAGLRIGEHASCQDYY